jgi:hypothetical protein
MSELGITEKEFDNVVLRPVLKQLYVNSQSFPEVPGTKGPLRYAVRTESAGVPRLGVYYRLEGDGEEWYWLEWVEIDPDWAAEHLLF